MNDNKKEQRAKSCDGKIKHLTELSVQYYIESTDKVGIEDYYQCKFCKKFHTFTIKGKEKLSNKKQTKYVQDKFVKGPRKMRLNGRGRNGHKGKR